jgi:DNA-binding NarL/FixJ family response regulator
MANGREGKIARLTGREREVAALVCNGLSNKIVAQKLNVSEGAIKIHLHTIFQKLRVRGRSELAVALFGIINVYSAKLQ